MLIREKEDVSCHTLCLYNLRFCFRCSASVLSSWLFLQAAMPEDSLATSLLAASKPAALLLEEVRRVLPALRRLSLLVSPVVAWLDLANFSQRLRSTCTIYPLQQQLQQLFLASGLISNPCSVQKRAPVLVLLCPDNHGIEEDALQIFSSTDISSSLRGPHCTDCN